MASEQKEPKAQFTPQQIEFFETKIRPVLAEHCYTCHSEKSKKLKGKLYLDSRVGILKGGETGPIVKLGKPNESRLIEAIEYRSTDLEMPPDKKLKDHEIKNLARWIEMGLPWPDEGKKTVKTQDEVYDWEKLKTSHWAWKAIKKPDVPQADGITWAKNPIDHFVARLRKQKGLKENSPASSRDLLRRMQVDLIGLPPTQEEYQAFKTAFEKDSDQAVSDKVDELLSSKHYGERWGRHWLDVARYSDGLGGFLDNRALNDAWRYRDWVVDSLNRDLPIDHFIKLQIAGDLIGETPTPVATGFLALGPTYNSDGGDPDSVAQAKGETLDDRVDTLTRGLLGLTVSCARCHSHKFDPIPHADYYSLAGIFNNTRVHEAPLAPKQVVDQYHSHHNRIKDLDKRIRDRENHFKKEKKTPNEEEKKEIEAWKAERAELRKTAPSKYPTGHALADSGSGDMHIALRGNLRKRGPLVPRRFLRILSKTEPIAYKKGSGRLELAEAITSNENPLTARVFVNRVWLNHFGKGLVGTPSNFGVLGEKPSHPELLDWLTHEFVSKGWSLKKLHKTIMTSATYRLSSQFQEAQFNLDGNNTYYWRFSPRRLEAESLRDAILKVTGELDRTFGGPPTQDVNTKRRTLYFKVSRIGDRFDTDAFLRLFDFPLMRATVAKRPTSIVPQQYLFLMNSRFMKDRAQALALKTSEGEKSIDRKIEKVYKAVLARQPSDIEKQLAFKFFGIEDGVAGKENPAASTHKKTDIEPKLWQQYCHALLCSNEFLFLR